MVLAHQGAREHTRPRTVQTCWRPHVTSDVKNYLLRASERQALSRSHTFVVINSTSFHGACAVCGFGGGGGAVGIHKNLSLSVFKASHLPASTFNYDLRSHSSFYSHGDRPSKETCPNMHSQAAKSTRLPKTCFRRWGCLICTWGWDVTRSSCNRQQDGPGLSVQETHSVDGETAYVSFHPVSAPGRGGGWGGAGEMPRKPRSREEEPLAKTRLLRARGGNRRKSFEGWELGKHGIRFALAVMAKGRQRRTSASLKQWLGPLSPRR